MSVNRDHNVASNTSSLLDIPFKKRKDSRLHVPLSPSYDDSGDGKKHKKNRRAKIAWTQYGEHFTEEHSHNKGICGSFSTFDDDDDDETVYVNPYLNHVNSNVMSQEGEACHNIISPSTPKRSSHMSVPDLNTRGQNQRAQDGVPPSHKCFNLPDGITSDVINCPYDFSLMRNESKVSGDTSKNMRCAYGETSDNFVSSLMLKGSDQLSQLLLCNDIAIPECLPSTYAEHKPVLKVNGDLVWSRGDRENTVISWDGTAGTHINADSLPSSSSKSCEDLSPLNNDLCSKNLSTHSKVSKNQSHTLPLSLKTRRSELVLPSENVVYNHSSSSPELPESDPYSNYKCDVYYKTAEQNSGLPSGVKVNNCGIFSVFQWSNHRGTESMNPSVSDHSNSLESFRDVDRFDGANNPGKNEGKYTELVSSNMLIFENKLRKFKRELPHLLGGTHCPEIGTLREGDAISKEGSQDSIEKKVGENIFVVGQQCQGKETNTKEGQCAVENAESPCRTKSCITEDSGMMPVKGKGVLIAVDHQSVVTQDVNRDSRKCSAEDPVVCIDDVQLLIGEKNKRRNSDHEDAILVSDDSDDDAITVYDVKNGLEETDDNDIEIVKCFPKHSAGKRDVSFQQKALDYTKSRAKCKRREHKERNVLAHPFEVRNVCNFSASLVKRSCSSSSDVGGNFMNKQKGNEQPRWWKSGRVALGGSSDNAMNAPQCEGPKPLCHRSVPAHASHMSQCDVYDLSHSTVVQGTSTPSSVSPVCSSFELPKRNTSPSDFTYAGTPCDFVSSWEYASSLDLPFTLSSSQCDKKHGCDTNLVPASDECEGSVWNPPIPNAGSCNTVASSSGSLSSYIKSIVPSSSEMSVEPDNQVEQAVPLTVMLQPMPVLDTALQTPENSQNVQNGKDITERQQNTVEDKTETAQRNSRPEWECAICLETISSKRGISATMCGHVYCTPCIMEVVCKKRECPTCRRTLDSTQVHPLFISG